MAASGFQSEIGSTDGEHIYVRGKDLVQDLMGKATFSEMAFLTIMGRLPNDRETKVLDCVLVSLVDHGITPSVAAARITYANAPEAIQGAVAAGLLGAGSMTLGTMENCGRMLCELEAFLDEDMSQDANIRAWLKDYIASGRRLPGFGHAVHSAVDPRATQVLQVAQQHGFGGGFVKLLKSVERETTDVIGKHLPINVTGAIAATLLEMGIEWQILRGFALISRTAGLVAHIREERQAPIAPDFRKLLRE